MMYAEKNGLRILTPAAGKWLYNGEVCSELVYLGKGASADDWQEVEEYIEAEEISDTEALSIITGGAT